MAKETLTLSADDHRRNLRGNPATAYAARRTTLVVLTLCKPGIWIANVAHMFITIGAVLMLMEGHWQYAWFLSGYVLITGLLIYKSWTVLRKSKNRRRRSRDKLKAKIDK